MPQLRLLVLAGLLLAALAVFGARVHWVEEAGSAERDGYVAKAETLLAGELPRDPFRPLLYPLLTAGLAALGLPTFAAARLLSNLAAVALVLAAWGFGRRLGGPRLAAWAAAATAVNPNVWIIGQHTTTDMLFAALAASSLLAALAYLERPAATPASLAGLAWGAAAFTRGSALFLLPGLVAAWLLARPVDGRVARPLRARLGHLMAAAGAGIAMLLPHWILRAAVFGDPFHDENWKNLAWKLYGYPDWSYLERVPFGGLGEVVAADPGAVVAGAVSELLRFAEGGLSQLLGTPVHALLWLAGAAVVARYRPRAAGWLLATGLFFLTAIAAVFFAWGRLLLVLLPGWSAFAFAPLAEPGDGLRRSVGDALLRRGRLVERWLPRAAGVLATALVGLLALKTLAFRLPAFIARHPTTEVAVLQQLDRELPPGGALAGTSPFLGRYLERPYLAIPDAFGAEVERPELYFIRLEALLKAAGARRLVVGEIDLRDRPRSLLSPSPPVSWLEPAGRVDKVMVWRLEPAAGAASDAAAIELDHPRP